MAQERSDFGLIGKALETTKIYGGSNIVKHFDAIVESDSLKTLGSYVREHGIESRGMDMDSKADDKLLKYNMVKITPTRYLDESENPMQMYLITDEKGHDIGTYEITENGPVFKLSPKIQKYNEKIMGEFQGQSQEILKERYKIDSLEDLVEKLSKNEKIALASKEQAKDDINEEFEKQGMVIGEGQEQNEEEKEALDRIPADQRGEAIEFAHENGLKLKDVLVVDSPKELSNQIDNRDNQIVESGGPVILIRANHGGADSLGDDVYAFQDGKAIQNEKNDNTLEDLMNQHRDEGQVPSLNDAEGIRMQEEVQKIIEESEAKIQQLEKMKEYEVSEGEDKEEIMGQLNKKIADIVADRNAKLKAIARERYPLKPFDEKGMDKLEDKMELPQEKEGDDVNQENEEQSDEQENEGMYKNRWDTANPYNHQ